MKPLAQNTLLQNRYLIVHLIGKGGMGEVYLAVDQRLGSAIALKRTFFSDDATLGNAFEREARTLARLRHPVLPKVSDHFTENDTQYLAMEHIAGEDLSERLKINKKPFPLNWVLFWADQLLDALAYLHTHEPPIIHRDIKPQNLKLTDENHIVLLDFGLAKNSLGETRVTTSGSVVGYTPHYAPMEQIRGTGTDARSDIYSLSATLYQILTNIVPPDALTRADAVIKGAEDPIKSMYEVNPEVSKLISDVILKGMSISQEPRYADAREMQTVLREAYARLQSHGSEQTVAFNAENIQENSNSQTSSDFKTTPPIISRVPATDLQTQIDSTNFNSSTAQKAAGISLSQGANYEQNLDTTLQYDSKTEKLPQKQSDIKTEVFLAGSTPAISYAQEKDPEQENFIQEDSFSQKESINSTRNLSTGNSFSQPENYSPEGTVPLISFDNKNGEADSIQMHATPELNSMTPTQTNEFSSTSFKENESYPQPEQVNSQSAQSLPAKPKSNKTLAIVGVLAGMFLMVIGAGGFAWYMLAGSPKATTEINKPEPTPEAAVTIAPSPEPTMEAITDTNTFTNTNTSTNTNVLNEETAASNTKIQRIEQTEKPAEKPKPVATGQQSSVKVETPKPTPQVVSVKPAQPTPPVKAKPKPTPKGARTDILQ